MPESTEGTEWMRPPRIVLLPEVSANECASCCGKLTRPAGSALYAPWHCEGCGAAWDPATGMLARKACLGCDATLELSDPDICVKCDEHGVIIVNGRAYEPVRN
jgi:hypothetical protein